MASRLTEFLVQYAWPVDKATSEGIPADITFSIQEIIGSVKVIDDAMHLQKHPEDNNFGLPKEALSEIPAGFLETLKGKAERHEHAKLPISYITNAVKAGLDMQLQEDRKDDTAAYNPGTEEVWFQ